LPAFDDTRATRKHGRPRRFQHRCARLGVFACSATLTALAALGVPGASVASAAPAATTTSESTPTGVYISASQAQRTRAYWTPARRAAARDLTMLPGARPTGTPPPRLTGRPVNPPEGPVASSAPVTRAFQAPLAIAAAGTPEYWTGDQDRLPASSMGTLYATTPTGPGKCSAVAVASEGKSTVFTAAHCVEEQDIGGGGAVGPAATIHFTNIAFEPGYRAGISPWGVFPARHIEDTHYEDWFDITHDFAAMSVWGNSAGNVVDLAGGQGVAWDQPRTQTSHVWGYPKGEVGDGEHLMHCVGTQRPDPAFTPAEDILLHDCISDFGGSGGAWLAGYRAGAGLGTVVGVTSGADLTLRVKAAHLTGGFHSLSYDAVRYDGGLNRYKASNGESWTTSRQPLPAGYSYERTLGSLFTSNAFSGRIPLYTCVSGSDHYLSKLPTCDGGTSLGLDGYALTPTGLQPAATYGLYRCRRQITNDRFVSNDPACEGGTFDQLLGYAVGSNALVRYYNGTSHRVTTNRIFGGGFSAEGTLGIVLRSPTAETIPIYGCRNGTNDWFLSRQSNCEGKTVLQVEAYLYNWNAPQPADTVGIYRCVRSNGKHFASTSAACEGSVQEGLLGYAQVP
jgi:hypothetical protein